MVNDPDLLLCDEPTGNLDPATSGGVSEALWRINRERQQAMLLVTHDERMADRADRVLRMVDGRLVENTAAVDPISPE
jgi:predicted ABC-type transport system involved in lysophospholipase L1 biosynthesis ATPase subunit